uniref:Thioredoxin domain-containing protein n=1 Tax=Plectus sambesii TaxID=2011161 RepID=A0A914W335_9BILA
MAPTPVAVIASVDEFSRFITDNAQLTAVIHFWASWSEPCVQLNKNLELLAADADNSKIVFAKIEAELVPEVSLAHKIVAVPTIVFIKNKKSFDRIDGFHPADVTKKVRQYSSGTVPAPIAGVPEKKAETKEELNKRLEKLIKQSRCVLFMKGNPDEPRCGSFLY